MTVVDDAEGEALADSADDPSPGPHGDGLLGRLPAVLGRLGHKVDAGRLPWAKKAAEIESEQAAGSPVFAR